MGPLVFSLCFKPGETEVEMLSTVTQDTRALGGISLIHESCAEIIDYIIAIFPHMGSIDGPLKPVGKNARFCQPVSCLGYT